MDTNLLEQARQVGEKLHHFHGGLRLRHNKKISCKVPIERAPMPQWLFVPLLQHAGCEARPLVKAGQSVRKGEPIARFDRPATGFIHAPTSGTVTAIARHAITHAAAAEGLCVVLKPDGLDRWTDLRPLADWTSTPPEVLFERIENSGIVGLGGAVFPTSKKLSSAREAGIHTLILNGAECEPWISCDEMLMRERPDEIVTGARVLQRTVGASQTVIAIEDQMGEVFNALQAAIAKSGCSDIRLIRVEAIYPEGGEKQLIQVLTGLEVPIGKRPADLGLICVNVATAAAVCEAVVNGKPLLERVVTVTGTGVLKPRNLLALIGTPIADLIGICGGYAPQAARLIIGGSLMGFTITSDESPVVKAANCVLVLTSADFQMAQQEMPCIRCGECARVCPAVLLPQTLQWQVRNRLFDDASDHGLGECIECGCCDLVCPSHIPLVAWFRFGKSELRSLGVDQARAEQAKSRFEARESRLAKHQREREFHLREKKRALKDDSEKKRRITAALSRAKARDGGDEDGGGKA